MTQIDEERPAAAQQTSPGDAQGRPCWFELTTADMAGATAFYGDLLGWKIADSGMDGMTYLIARAGDDMAAGMMAPQQPGQPTGWMIYVAVEDCAATISEAKAAGGSVFFGPESAPGVGSFAVIGDPQGAAIGVMQPEAGSPDSKAWNQNAEAHGNWIELMASDHAAVFSFYEKLFGWTRGDAMAMGEMGDYQLFRRKGVDIGGMMTMKQAPQPYWLPYFGTGNIDAAVEKIAALGGKLLNGPVEVPGPAYIVQALDPQGCVFALVGVR